MLSSLGISCSERTIAPATVNKSVLSSQDFALDAQSVNLSTKISGTVFVTGDAQHPKARHVTISAHIETDGADLGGIEMHFSPGWNITNITTNYPQVPGRTSGIKSSDHYIYANRAPTGASPPAFAIWIGAKWVGQEGMPWDATGNILIELDPSPELKILTDYFEINAGLGYKISDNGNQVISPVKQMFQVPLNPRL